VGEWVCILTLGSGGVGVYPDIRGVYPDIGVGEWMCTFAPLTVS